MTRAEVVEPLATREMVVEVHWGACVHVGTEVGANTGGVCTSACVSMDAEFFQRGREGSAVMLPKHVHLLLGVEAVA